MVQASQRHIVALTRQIAVGVHQFFGHDEQRDTFHTRNQFAVRPRNLGQHQMHDVFGQLMVARADPHLVALEAIARPQCIAVKVGPIGFGTRKDVAQAGARLRLRQGHGASPAAIEFIVGKHLLLHGRTVHAQQVGVAHGQQVRANADAGTAKETVGCRFHHIGQLHASLFIRLCGAEHAAVSKGFARIVRALWLGDFLAIKRGLLCVYRAIEGGVFFTCYALASVHDRIERFAAVVGVTVTAGQVFGLQPVVHQEFKGRSQLRHSFKQN